MSVERISLRATHPAEWLAALPVLVGYQLHHGSAVTFTDPDGAMVCTAAVHNGTSRDQLLDAFTGQAPGLRDAGAVTSWTAVHDLDPVPAAARSRMLADVLHDAGLPRPAPQAQFAVDAGRAWCTVLHDPRPDQMWRLDDHPAVHDRLELLLGPPATDRAHVGHDLTAQPGILRDDIAASLPAAAAEPEARTDPARWRIRTAAQTMARLSDPQPWTGPTAAAALLALSDESILAFLLDHVTTTNPGVWLTPDTGQLAALVRAAPPGLVAGPATLLAGALTSRGMATSRARAAAALALADRPDNTTAMALLSGLARGDRPREVLAHAVGGRIADPNPVGPVFTASDGHWPDPLAAPSDAASTDPWLGPDPGHGR